MLSFDSRRPQQGVGNCVVVEELIIGHSGRGAKQETCGHERTD